MDSSGSDPIVFRIVDWLIGGVFTISTTVVGWLVSNAHTKIDKQTADIDQLWKAHSNFRVEVSNDYVKSHTIDRVYDTLDEIKDDIKLLLQRKI